MPLNLHKLLTYYLWYRNNIANNVDIHCRVTTHDCMQNNSKKNQRFKMNLLRTFHEVLQIENFISIYLSRGAVTYGDGKMTGTC